MTNAKEPRLMTFSYLKWMKLVYTTFGINSMALYAIQPMKYKVILDTRAEILLEIIFET